MKESDSSLYRYTLQTLYRYLGIMLCVAIILGILHYFFLDLKEGGVYWFNLDKERNIQTWFSGVIFFLIGFTSIFVYSCEKKYNEQNGYYFRLPILWLGVALVGFFMSLDEITILHENLFWREIRYLTVGFNNSWRYLTQWQVLFAPAILLILCYFIIFFSNRFSISNKVRNNAFIGIGCWMGALFLEGIRHTFKLAGSFWYSLHVLFEEELEMIGGIFLLGTIALYSIIITLDFTSERCNYLKRSKRFLSKRAIVGLILIILGFSAISCTIYLFARRHALKGVPIPSLYRKAMKTMPKKG